MSESGSPRRARVPAALLAAAVLFLAVTMWMRAGSGLPMSTIDEHVHLDTHVVVHDGRFPSRGDLMTQDVVEEWACGVGHEGGATAVPCGDPTLGPQSLPSGQYTTGYIHYPTYFLGAEAYRWVASKVSGGDDWVTTYRHWAVLLYVAGTVAIAFAGWRLGLRRWSLVGATLAPVAAPGIAMYGMMANPQSAMILLGALIAWPGIQWLRTGSGFWWLLAATTLASSVAVTHTLPAGAFMLAATLAVVARRFGWRPAGDWDPRWWHVVALGAVIVLPVLAYGRFIAGRATISNDELYAFAAYSDWTQIVVGAVSEVFHLHTMWFYADLLPVDPAAGLVAQLGEAFSQGTVEWLHIVVFGAALATIWLLRPRRTAVAPADEHAAADAHDADAGSSHEDLDGARTYAPLWLLVLSAVVGLLLFPPALRVSNALQIGIDYPIVARYGFGFGPLLVWAVLLALPRWPLGGVLAAVALPAAVGLALAML